MNFIVLLLSIFSLSCKEKESNNKSINYNRTEIASSESYFNEVKYVKKDIVNQKNIFEYKDFKVSIEYGGNSLIGFSQNNSMNYYKFNYDLDSGDLDLLRFRGNDGDLFIVELDDHYLRFYNIYYVIKDNVFYLGNIDTDLSKIIEENPNLKLKFQISKKDNKIEIQQLLEDKKFYLKSFVMNNALQSVSFKDKTSNYNKDWLGEYEIKKNINNKMYEQGADEFSDVTNGGTSGLVDRRNKEIEMFKNNIYDSAH